MCQANDRMIELAHFRVCARARLAGIIESIGIGICCAAPTDNPETALEGHQLGIRKNLRLIQASRRSDR
jgi:hypothetical protein